MVKEMWYHLAQQGHMYGLSHKKTGFFIEAPDESCTDEQMYATIRLFLIKSSAEEYKQDLVESDTLRPSTCNVGKISLENIWNISKRLSEWAHYLYEEPLKIVICDFNERIVAETVLYDSLEEAN